MVDGSGGGCLDPLDAYRGGSGVRSRVIGARRVGGDGRRLDEPSLRSAFESVGLLCTFRACVEGPDGVHAVGGLAPSAVVIACGDAPSRPGASVFRPSVRCWRCASCGLPRPCCSESGSRASRPSTKPSTIHHALRLKSRMESAPPREPHASHESGTSTPN